MKTKHIALLAAVGLLPLTGFAQTPTPPPIPPTPAVPAVPAVPPVPAVPGVPRDKGPKIPVTFLGVETSEVPNVVSEQLGLAKGFGLVIDYVVPDGPAATAGLQQNDILKMLNDQILTEPDQLAKLIRSFPEGTTVTLTVLRKGAETKLQAKLAKREVPDRRRGFEKFGFNGGDWEQFGLDMGKLGEEIGNQFGSVKLADVGREQARLAREQGQRAREEGQRAREEGQRAREQAREEGERAREESRRARDEARRAADENRRAAREMRVSRSEDGSVKSTTIDMRRAQIIFHDDKGELKIENVSGQKVLTAKDPQGRLVFSGPVGTKEELDKMPADVRQRYEKLEQKDLPAINPSTPEEEREKAVEAAEDDADEDESDGEAVQEVSLPRTQAFPYGRLGFNTVLI